MEESFEQLFEAYRGRIYQVCLRIVGDEESAEDLTQEAFVRAYSKFDTFRSESSFYTWLYAIARNLSISHLRKRREVGELMEERVAAPEEIDQEIDPQWQGLIDELPEKQRVVFVLYVLEGVPQKEIAARLNVPLGTIRSRLYYARKFLQSSVKSLQ